MLYTLFTAALMTLSPESLLLLQRFTEQENRPSLSEGLFDKQAEVMASRALRKSLVCGRRGGKTTMDARLLLESADNNPAIGEDESITCFIGPTKNHARRLIWGRLQTVSKQFHIDMAFNNTDLIATQSNGAQVWVMGADDDRDVSRMRGFPFRRIVIDESQAVGADFEDLVDEVLDPALADYNGDLILTGTPNAACRGYFYKATTGQLLDDHGNPQYKSWTWTVLDNPEFPIWRGKRNWRALAEAWLRKYRAKKGWAEDNPSFLREWMARWTRDEGGLVVKYNPARNNYAEIPKGYNWMHVLGLDLGKGLHPRKYKNVPKGNFALNVWAFCEDLPDVYSVYQYKKQGLEITDWVAHIKDAQLKYKPIATVADCGALGEVIVSDIARRFGISIKPAEKREKNAAIELLNDGLLNGHVFVKDGSPLADEWSILQWDEDRAHEDPRFPNDLSDSALYGHREARHYLYTPIDDLPEIGTSAHSDLVAKRMKEQRQREQRKRLRKKRRG